MENNETKLTIPEIVSSATVTQQIEIDYVLPDYKPEIMRIIRCSASHYVSNKTLSPEKLTVDIVVVHTIIYQSYDMSVNTVKIENSYVKGVDITDFGAPDEAQIRLTTDYCSCKATGKRRVGIRTNIGIGYAIYAASDYNPFFIEDGIEIKSESVSATILKAVCEKTVSFKEKLEEDISEFNIIDSPARVRIADHRVVSGKVIVKGDLEITIMAINEDLAVLAKPISIPFGQIFDLNGAEETDRCEISADCRLINFYGDGEEGERGSIEAFISFNCKVYGDFSAELPIDAYSTQYECYTETKAFTFADYRRFGEKNVHIDFSLGKMNTEISKVDYLYINPSVISSEEKENSVLINCLADAYIIGSDDSKTAVGISRKGEFNIALDLSGFNDVGYNFSLLLENYSYSLSLDGELTVSAEFNLSFSVCKKVTIPYLSSFSLIEDKPKLKDGKAALTVYYAEKGESVFDIGKRYNISQEMLREENEINCEILSEKRRLIIPLKA